MYLGDVMTPEGFCQDCASMLSTNKSILRVPRAPVIKISGKKLKIISKVIFEFLTYA